jgi:hypothetical protein
MVCSRCEACVHSSWLDYRWDAYELCWFGDMWDACELCSFGYKWDAYERWSILATSVTLVCLWPYVTVG